MTSWPSQIEDLLREADIPTRDIKHVCKVMEDEHLSLPRPRRSPYQLKVTVSGIACCSFGGHAGM